MEVASSRNRGVRGAHLHTMLAGAYCMNKSSRQVKEQSLDDHMRASFAFADDFEDLFEEARDHSTTATPDDKPEGKHSGRSPSAVVDESTFDPFSEIGSMRTSFYEKEKEMDLKSSFTTAWSLDDESNKGLFESQFREKQGFGEATGASFDSPFKLNRRASTSNLMSSSKSEHSPRRSDFPLLSSPSCRGFSNAPSGDFFLNNTGHGSPQRRSSLFGDIKYERSEKPRFEDESEEETEDRPSWTLNYSSHSQRHDNLTKSPTKLIKANKSHGLSAPVTPGNTTFGFKKHSSPSNSPRRASLAAPQTFMSPTKTTSRLTRRASVSTGLGKSPTKMIRSVSVAHDLGTASPMRMIRTASVATGLGSSTHTPRLNRRASVADGLGSSAHTPRTSRRASMAAADTRGKPTSFHSPSKIGGKVDQDTVTKIIKQLLKEKKQKKAKTKAGSKKNDSSKQRKKVAKKLEQQDSEDELQLLQLDDTDSERSSDSDDTSAYCSMEDEDDSSVTSLSEESVDGADTVEETSHSERLARKAKKTRKKSKDKLPVDHDGEGSTSQDKSSKKKDKKKKKKES